MVNSQKWICLSEEQIIKIQNRSDSEIIHLWYEIYYLWIVAVTFDIITYQGQVWL